MISSKYVYPDNGDKLTTNMISNIELHQRDALIDVIQKISSADIKEINILLEQIQLNFSVNKDMKALQWELEQIVFQLT